MEFKVKFVSTTGKAVSMPYRNIGLDMLDLYRRRIGIDFNNSVVVGHIDDLRTDVEIKIPERTARDSGLFRDDNSVTIKTKKGALNDYTEIDVKMDFDTESNSIKKVYANYSVQKNRVLEHWVNSGFALEIGY